MGGDRRSTSAATCTRRHYERLLLPFERYLNGFADRELPVQEEEDGEGESNNSGEEGVGSTASNNNSLAEDSSKSASGEEGGNDSVFSFKEDKKEEIKDKVKEEDTDAKAASVSDLKMASDDEKIVKKEEVTSNLPETNCLDLSSKTVKMLSPALEEKDVKEEEQPLLLKFTPTLDSQKKKSSKKICKKSKMENIEKIKIETSDNDLPQPLALSNLKKSSPCNCLDCPASSSSPSLLSESSSCSKNKKVTALVHPTQRAKNSIITDVYDFREGDGDGEGDDNSSTSDHHPNYQQNSGMRLLKSALAEHGRLATPLHSITSLISQMPPDSSSSSSSKNFQHFPSHSTPLQTLFSAPQKPPTNFSAKRTSSSDLQKTFESPNEILLNLKSEKFSTSEYVPLPLPAHSSNAAQKLLLQKSDLHLMEDLKTQKNNNKLSSETGSASNLSKDKQLELDLCLDLSTKKRCLEADSLTSPSPSSGANILDLSVKKTKLNSCKDKQNSTAKTADFVSEMTQNGFAPQPYFTLKKKESSFDVKSNFLSTPSFYPTTDNCDNQMMSKQAQFEQFVSNSRNTSKFDQHFSRGEKTPMSFSTTAKQNSGVNNSAMKIPVFHSNSSTSSSSRQSGQQPQTNLYPHHQNYRGSSESSRSSTSASKHRGSSHTKSSHSSPSFPSSVNDNRSRSSRSSPSVGQINSSGQHLPLPSLSQNNRLPNNANLLNQNSTSFSSPTTASISEYNPALPSFRSPPISSMWPAWPTNNPNSTATASNSTTSSGTPSFSPFSGQMFNSFPGSSQMYSPLENAFMNPFLANQSANPQLLHDPVKIMEAYASNPFFLSFLEQQQQQQQQAQFQQHLQAFQQQQLFQHLFASSK